MITEEKIEKYKIEYTRHCRAQKKAQSTIDTYWSAVGVFLKKFDTQSINRVSWREIADYILTHDNSKTIDQKRYAIELFYQVCLNRPGKLKQMPRPKHPKTIPQVLNIVECYSIFSKIGNLKHRAFIQLSYACALRISEVLSIKVKHLDGRDKVLFIEQSKGAKDRKVPVPQETLILLRAYFKQYFKTYTPETLLFQGQAKDHSGYSEASIRAVLKRACVAAGVLKPVKFHTLRHSRATHWYNAGLQLRDIALLLGHNNIKTTEIYVHAGLQDLQTKLEAADRIIQEKLNMYTQKKIAA